MILRGTPPSPPAVSAFALDRMPMARGLHNMVNRVEPVLEGELWAAAASTCISCVAAWKGGEAAIQATRDMAAGVAIPFGPEQVAWIHYEIELLSAWMAAAQASVNIQVDPGSLARISAQTTIAPPIPSFPSYPTCIRMDGTRPRKLPNGMPVDMVFVEYIEHLESARFMLVTPLGNGLQPMAEGAAFVIELSDIGSGLERVLHRSIDRKVEEMSGSKLIRFDADAFRSHLREQVAPTLAIMPIAFQALREADGREHMADRLAPAAVRAMDSGDRAKADWGDVIYI